ncbi:MAG: IPT/TIG domain-containing protein [Deltaproteobacteria bacterium]|nr:IPT/TIG domain-containing protein [Deltaproteobacteria bacterium]
MKACCAIGLLLLPLWLLSGCAGSESSPVDAGRDADAGEEPDAADGDGEPDGADGGDRGPVELRLLAVLPSRGLVEGGTWANIVGSGFVEGIAESAFDVRDVTDVSFGDNSAIDIEVIRDDMISVRTPAGLPGPVDVCVENPNGRVTLPAAFTYFETVAAFSFEPPDLSAEGGTPFTLEGTGLTGESRVLFNDRPASQIEVESSTRMSGAAPPGEPGPVNLEVVNRNGSALLFRAADYHPIPQIDAIAPAAGPTAGGTDVEIRGQGFSDACELFFSAEPVTGPGPDSAMLWSAVSPPGLAGPADVRISNPVAESTLESGFVYLPEASGGLSVTGVAPGSGPVSGGQEVIVAGEGFSAPLRSVRFGGAEATSLQVIDDRQARVSVPEGDPGMVAVRVSTDAGQASLANAYRFYRPLEVTGIEPGSGPAEGGTPFRILGSSMTLGVQATFGGTPVPLQLVSETEMTGIAPPGPPGPVDVRVFDGDSEIRLPGAFTYLQALDLARVDPDTGSQAGGTWVRIYGQGFGPELQVFFGDQPAHIVQILSPSLLTARTPRGEPGEVAVRAERGAERFELPAGFSYYDPTNDRGGASGGPINGSLNVTVLDGSWAFYGDPLPEATVLVAEPAISALTDDRGQVTLSGPSLVRELTITMGKAGYQAVTVSHLNAANLTVYLSPNEQEPPETQPGTIRRSSLSGRVFGFKDIPDLPSGPGISMQAKVTSTSYSIYYVPPYGGVPGGTPIEVDGGEYSFSVQLGTYSLYALYGALDQATGAFTPGLLGVRRAIVIPSEDPVTDQDIILSTPLDRSAHVRHVDPPAGWEGQPAEYGAYVSLDLGRDGIIYLSQSEGNNAETVLHRLPEAAGQSFLFVGLASMNGSYPLSYTFRRQEGDLDAGVELGPYLGFTRFEDPAEEGQELDGGRIAWSFDGPTPALSQLWIQTADLLPKVIWRVILPGDVTEVVLPEELEGLLPQGELLLIFLYTASSPRFNFDRFNYNQLYTGRWTAYTVNLTWFAVP